MWRVNKDPGPSLSQTEKDDPGTDPREAEQTNKRELLKGK